MLQAGTAADGLSAEIPAPLYARVRKQINDIGLPASLCDNFKAWLCAVSLSVIEFQTAGMLAEHGLDQHFYQRASIDGRELHWLETPDQQLAIFSGMSEALGEIFLRSALDDLMRPELRPEALFNLWRQNNVQKLDSILDDTRREFPQIHQRLLSRRNRAWMAPLRTHLDGNKAHLIVVGAAHLLGSDGLLTLLRQHGYTITPATAMRLAQ